ncbi:MAG: hypothetical protein ACOX7B_09350 [Christensenellales bacterium]|jgi:hypothetical protein
MSTDTEAGGVALFLLDSALGLGKIPLDTSRTTSASGCHVFPLSTVCWEKKKRKGYCGLDATLVFISA